MNQKQHFIWMPLIGFDREQEDKGVSELLDKAGFIPAGVSVFLFHPDIVNEHENMDREFTLHNDNCSYFASPRNEFRERQEWTNYELRTLVHNLTAKGMDAFLGIDGVFLENVNHPEWEDQHRELLSIGCNGAMNLNVLKRFKDGTFYEDYFLDKIVKATTDYGFTGLHVADFFCPPEHSIVNGDFSADLMEQFISHSKVSFPAELAERLTYDEQADINARQVYIWNQLRREWIDFYVWRWERFWTKICTALHAIGKKVMINNAWCSDPFEALYRYGIDYKKLYHAGVDYFVAETVPNGMELLDGIGNHFYQYMSMAQLMSVFSPAGKLLTLLGVKDCTEEWDMLHHAPCRLERDIYTLSSMMRKSCGRETANASSGKAAYENSCDGLMITLGDGITQDEWRWILQRADIGFSLKPSRILESTVLWSDNAHYALLDLYIHTRRPSLHKIMYDLKNAGVSLGGVARVENLSSLEGTIFVPNFDLYSPEEQAAVLSYQNGTVICVAGPEFSPNEAGIECDVCVKDTLANYQLCVFTRNLTGKNGAGKTSLDIADLSLELQALFADKTPVTECSAEPMLWKDESFFLQQMPFRAVSNAFISVCGKLLDAASDNPFAAEAVTLTSKLSDKKYRIYVFNNQDLYKRFEVTCKETIDHVENVSKYPLMPVRYLRKDLDSSRKFDGAKDDSIKINVTSDAPICGFVAKTPPYGLSIFDVVLK